MKVGERKIKELQEDMEEAEGEIPTEEEILEDRRSDQRGESKNTEPTQTCQGRNSQPASIEGRGYGCSQRTTSEEAVR